MSRFLGVIFGLGTALSLSACGFHPLYATGTTPEGMSNYFGQVFVETIPGRQGVHLRNQLMDALTPQGTPASAAYKLSVKLEDVREGLAIRRNTEITRYNYRLTARSAVPPLTAHLRCAMNFLRRSVVSSCEKFFFAVEG